MSIKRRGKMGRGKKILPAVMALTLAAGSITGCSASSAKTETAKESMQSQAETKTTEQSTRAEKTSEEAAYAAGEAGDNGYGKAARLWCRMKLKQYSLPVL